MVDLIIYFGSAVIGAIVGVAIVSLLSKYWEKAKEAFKKAWRTISRLFRAVGVLIRRGNKLFKLFVAQTLLGEYESYEDEEDEGVEIEWDNLTPEAKKALSEDNFITTEIFVTA